MWRANRPSATAALIVTEAARNSPKKRSARYVVSGRKSKRTVNGVKK